MAQSLKLLVLSEIKFSYFKTRKQQLLSRFSPRYEILFCEPYKRGLKNEIVPFYAKDNIRIVTVPFLKNAGGVLGKLVGMFRWVGFLLGLFWLKLVLKRSGFDKPDAVIFSNLYAVPFLSLFDSKTLLIYDMNDNHTAFANCPKWLSKLQQEAFEQADIIVTSNHALRGLISPTYQYKECYIGNGVDLTIPNRILT